jgi:polar amino acid transport system substrate-binding protein
MASPPRRARLTASLAAVLCLTGHAMALPVKVVTFESPPLMGASKLSAEGLEVELMRAAFRLSGLEPTIEYYPQARAASLFRNGEFRLMLGTRSFFPDISGELEGYPLITLRTIFFYLKKDEPNFSWKTYDDLRPYTIALILGGASEKVTQAQGLKGDPSNDQPTEFRKLEAGRVDLALGTDLGGWLIIEDLFPDKVHRFAADEAHPFLSLAGELVAKRSDPGFADLDARIKSGIKGIYRSGEWLRIMEKYYGRGKVPPDALRLLSDYSK